jgi:hypothetical protein
MGDLLALKKPAALFIDFYRRRFHPGPFLSADFAD